MSAECTYCGNHLFDHLEVGTDAVPGPDGPGDNHAWRTMKPGPWTTFAFRCIECKRVKKITLNIPFSKINTMLRGKEEKKK